MNKSKKKGSSINFHNWCKRRSSLMGKRNNLANLSFLIIVLTSDFHSWSQNIGKSMCETMNAMAIALRALTLIWSCLKPHYLRFMMGNTLNWATADSGADWRPFIHWQNRLIDERPSMLQLNWVNPYLKYKWLIKSHVLSTHYCSEARQPGQWHWLKSLNASLQAPRAVIQI